MPYPASGQYQPGFPPGAGYPAAGPYPPAANHPPTYGYPSQPFYGTPAAADPTAPYGRDPMTGQPLSDKSKVVAGLLQLFLGGFGAGRFYLGSYPIAIAQLVTWFVGLLLAVIYIGFLVWMALGIWALVDAIMIFTGSVRDQHGRPLRS
ncbi:TM2 domain-containing protein [Mycobacterium sp. M1]|uniref:TM2 domain-containing protein n=2 Tax=Mycolicibacter acidiphilus TaxID=2835306 RepID=A0ABS5RH20_9MYCO|nr:TM2 domain-containing protein [Mycolicibacter acidiphilus]